MQQNIGKFIGALSALLLLGYLLAIYWSVEPAKFDVVERAKQQAQSNNEKMVTGYVTTNTLISVSETLLQKPGGYLSNDMLPPSVFMDNMPAWEMGH